MRTWKEITEDTGFEPQYLCLDLKIGETTKSIVGILIDERMQCDDVPSDWHVYDIRHADDDWSEPISIEPGVLVNFMGRFLTDQELTFPDTPNNYIEVSDYSYEDWDSIAYDTLEEAGADPTEIDNLIMQWDNLDTPSNNVRRILAPSLH